MPTLLQWEYEAKNDSSIKERRGIQRSFFGDTVVDDYLGQGRGLALHLPLNGDRQIKIEFIENGTKDTREVSASSVSALASREHKPARAPTKSSAAKGQEDS